MNWRSTSRTPDARATAFNRSGTMGQRTMTGGGTRVPFQFDALLNIDGTILQVESNYYLADKSINHRHLLITGYDFPENWSGGVPYKSAATLSAPVGDTEFIAFDTAYLNNFWYTDGTPNQIPVVSLFQDIDYAHLFFTRHLPQQVDVNGVETFEPRVKEIVIYANAKAGADLIKCNSYYSVPVEDTNAKWVDFVNGVDEASGSKAAPWKTLAGLLTKDLTGVTNVYFKTGGTSITGNTTLNKDVNYVAVGGTSIARSSTYSLSLSTNLLFKGFHIISESAKGYAFINNNSATIEKIKVSGLHQYGALRINADATVKDVILNDRLVILGNGGTILGGYFSSTQNIDYAIFSNGGSGKRVIKYNRFIKGSIINTVTSDFDIINNETSYTGLFYNQNTSAITGTVNILHNIVYMKGHSTFIKTNSAVNDIIVRYTWNIANNKIFVKGNYAGAFVSLRNQSNVVVENNIVIGEMSNGIRLCEFFNYNTTVSNIRVNNNYVYAASTSGQIIFGTEDGVSVNKISGINVYNNHLTLSQYFGIFANPHAIGIFDCANAKIHHNYVNGASIGTVIKDTYLGEVNNGEIYNNVYKNCTSSSMSKGAIGVKFYNNTYIRTSEDFDGDIVPKSFITILSNSIVGGGTNTIVKNNIFVDNEKVDVNSSVYGIDVADVVTGLVANNNVVYTQNVLVNGVTYPTLAEWQAAGFDTNSQFTNPNLTPELWPTSPITIGENLGTDYDDGLDITTNWGSATQVPSVVTKQQSVPWQVGAYVQ